MHILIIGGGDAGIAAALRARELDRNVRISVLLADDYPNFSLSGLPFLIGGQVPNWRSLAHRTAFPGIDIMRGHRATSIDPVAKVVTTQHHGNRVSFGYDRLIVATGARPLRRNLPSADVPGTFLLHTMSDGFAVVDRLNHEHVRTAVVVGGGRVALEMAESLRRRDVDVTVLSESPELMPNMFSEIGARIRDRLEIDGVEVITSVEVERVEQGPTVITAGGTKYPADLVLLATGIEPSCTLARTAGAKLGAHGAIEVSAAMTTSLPDVLAAGDCVTTHHRMLTRPTWMPLGTTAHKQGRIAGENALGGSRQFEGVVGTQVVKLYDLVIARTGLSDEDAAAEGFTPKTVEIGAWDHQLYYPGASQVGVWLTGDQRSGRLLGVQLIGRQEAEISKRIDAVAVALFQNADVETLNDYDFSYTPALSSPWDPIQHAAQAWSRACR